MTLNNMKLRGLIKVFAEYNTKYSIEYNMRELKVSYAWLYKTLKYCQEQGYLRIIKSGRINKVRFTDMGKYIKSVFTELKSAIGDN